MLTSNYNEENMFPVERESDHGVLEDNLSHLNGDFAGEIMEVLRATKIAAPCLWNLGLANVPLEHSFALTD